MFTWISWSLPPMLMGNNLLDVSMNKDDLALGSQ